MLPHIVLFNNWLYILISSIEKEGVLRFAQLHAFLIFGNYDCLILGIVTPFGGEVYCVACVHFVCCKFVDRTLYLFLQED